MDVWMDGELDEWINGRVDKIHEPDRVDRCDKWGKWMDGYMSQRVT